MYACSLCCVCFNLPNVFSSFCCWLVNTYLIEGDDSGRVIIWNMAPVKHEKDEKDENVPKLLCQMDNHLGELSFLLAIGQ